LGGYEGRFCCGTVVYGVEYHLDGDFKSICNTVGELKVLLSGQTVENESEVEVTLASDFASKFPEQVGH